VCAIALGSEDLIDHDHRRHGLARRRRTERMPKVVDPDTGAQAKSMVLRTTKLVPALVALPYAQERRKVAAQEPLYRNVKRKGIFAMSNEEGGCVSGALITHHARGCLLPRTGWPWRPRT